MRRSLCRATWACVLSFTALAPSASATTVGPQLELQVGPAGTDQRAPALAWDATAQTYVMVWQDGRSASNGTDLFAARIASDGTLNPADTSGCALVTDPGQVPGDETQPAIVALPAGGVAVAWREARTGVNDIFLARFNTSACTAQPNVAVTAGTDSEVLPALSVSGQNLLVSYQVTLVGGGQLIRGRRYDLNLTAQDGAPSALSPSGAARPAGLGLNTDHAVAWDLGGDVFARVVPASGPIGLGSPVLVSNANLSQSRIRLLALSGGQVGAVWQDGRLGVNQEDVWGRRLSASLSPQAAEASLSGASAAQLSPQASGDGNRAFAVWQDRRHSTINAVIYGTRIDPSSGAPLDPDGLPVLVTSGNAFEAAVVRGPGADFLVAAVQFGSPSRIFYRLVRDELPSGVMTAPPMPSAPADGSTAVNLSFGPAVGPSGLSVIDGTLYTVTLSLGTATLSQPDADPVRAGHQVPAVGGQVLVSVRSPQAGTCQVQLSSAEGSASGSAQAVFTNSPPSVSQVIVAPSSPTSLDDLQLSYLYLDPNGDPESGSSIQWTRNSAVQPNYADLLSVPASATRRGDQWRASVTPSDGGSMGSVVFSNSVTVLNAAPSAQAVQISPDTDVRSGSLLNGRYTYDDPDLDPESGSALAWFLDDVQQLDLNDASRVPGARVVKGQTWRFEVRPSDGLDVGPPAASAPVTVVNTAPIARAGEDGEVMERGRYVLDGRGSSDQDPQDVLQFEWSQIMSGGEPEVPLSSTSSPTPSLLAPSVRQQTVLTFQLSVFDGEAPSGASRVRVTVRPLPDLDNDGLDDAQEAEAGTDPSRADTDQDGLSDGEELALGTDPRDEDSDDDGVRDGAEGRSCPDCQDFEPEADPDGDQRIAALDPDTDGDGLLDGTELSVREPLRGGGAAPYAFAGTDEGAGSFAPDLDPDSATEVRRADTDHDGLSDGAEDANHNGRLDPGESDPNDPTDPGLACGPSQPCPDPLVCQEGRCEAAPDTDGGAGACTPLPSTVMCCNAGCTGGRPVAPLCLEPGSAEVCPVGADLCVAGACTEGGASRPPPAGGCTCARPGPKRGIWLGVALGAVVLVRRRRASVLVKAPV